MKTKDEIAKIEAVVLFVLQKYKEGIDYIKLFKIIYFSQKEFLAKYGKPIVADTFKARKFGPVPTLSDKVIKSVENEMNTDDFPDLKDFSEAISVKDQFVFARKDADKDYLSRKEMDCIEYWAEWCRDKDSIKDLSPMSHDEAWKTAWERSQDDPQQDVMTMIEIARAGGASKKMVAYIREKELISA